MMKKCRLATNDGRLPKSILRVAILRKREGIDLTFVGPEGYLSDGIVNIFQEEGQRIVGPKKEAAILEGSKCRTKDFLKDIGVPVPLSSNFADPHEAKDYVTQYCDANPDKGLVIKADGLAAGKGSVVCSSLEESLSTIDRIMVSPRLFGDAGNRIEVEERLIGRELMFFAITDGRTVLPMESAMDYKQAFSPDEKRGHQAVQQTAGNPNLDNNPNTGGMGGFSPHPWLDEELQAR